MRKEPRLSESSSGESALSQLYAEAKDLRGRVQSEAQQHPLRTAGIAVGVGYLLGGGLFSGLTARLLGTTLKVGLRVALIPLITQSLSSWGEDFVQSSKDTQDEPEAPAGQPFAPSPSASKKQLRQNDPKENNS